MVVGGRGVDTLDDASFVGQHAAVPEVSLGVVVAPQIANNEGPKVDPPVSKTWARMEGLVPPPPPPHPLFHTHYCTHACLQALHRLGAKSHRSHISLVMMCAPPAHCSGSQLCIHPAKGLGHPFRSPPLTASSAWQILPSWFSDSN